MATRPKTDRAKSAGYFITGMLLAFVGSWAFMLLIGNVHHNWLHSVPPLGYWDTLLLFVLADIVFGAWAFAIRVKVLD